MIICFEGPSAVGKTTLCQHLRNNFLTIPEVNLLFKSPIKTSKFWYYDKQFKRFALANTANQSAILDGDIFQPLWYNWTYGFPTQFPNLEETIQYYKIGLTHSLIQFPDLYFVFTASTETLIQRKEGDRSRRRGNFAKHLKLLQTQEKYFRFLQEQTNIQVEFISYETVQSAKEKVLKSILSNSIVPIINPIETLLKIGNWLKNTAI